MIVTGAVALRFKIDEVIIVAPLAMLPKLSIRCHDVNHLGTDAATSVTSRGMRTPFASDVAGINLHPSAASSCFLSSETPSK